MKKVVVLAYGVSSEKEVSMLTGTAVFDALIKKGYDAYLVKVTDDIQKLVNELVELKPDVVFNALHGKFGEDGNMQGLLNLMHIPYTHSGVLASALGMNKWFAKKIAESVGVPVAPDILVCLDDMRKGVELPFPYVVKPIDEGSSTGVHIIENETQEKNLMKNWPFGGALVMLETYIRGRELTVSVLNGKALGVTEIAPKKGFYDYQNKYQAGRTEHILPAPISEGDANILMKYAEKIHMAFGCKGASRCDFRYDDTGPSRPPHIIFLEINTQPGLTDLSLLPEAAKYVGISYENLVSLLVEEAECEK